jgi:hypothetical protein
VALGGTLKPVAKTTIAPHGLGDRIHYDVVSGQDVAAEEDASGLSLSWFVLDVGLHRRPGFSADQQPSTTGPSKN